MTHVGFLSFCFVVIYLEQEDNEESKYLFILNLSSEKGQIRFGCVTSSEREQWLQWFTRATGQTDKPAELKKETFSEYKVFL